MRFLYQFLEKFNLDFYKGASKLKILILFLSLISLIFLSACSDAYFDVNPIQIFGYYENEYIPDTVVLENEYLILEYNTKTAGIIITKKATGETWQSIPDNAEDEYEAFMITRMLMQSPFSLEFSNSQGMHRTMDAFRYSIMHNNFRHDIVDNGINISFTVGSVDTIFEIPDAISEYRMLYFINNLEQYQINQIHQVYRLINIQNLLPTDNREELLEILPSLEYQNIFVMRDGIQDWILERAENLLHSAGYTTDDWIYDMYNFSNEIIQENPIFNIILRYELDGNSFIASIEFDYISYIQNYPITRLNILPFFGAGSRYDDGYILLPDGSGSLLHFDNNRNNQLFFQSNIFGWDSAINRDAIVNDNRSAYPVFGIYRNGSNFLAIIEEGASYAAIRAEAPGMTAGRFAYAHATFRMIQMGRMDIDGQGLAPFYVFERRLPRNERIAIRYIFPESPGYVGMAVAYREFLQERYPNLRQRIQNPSIAAVEFLGAIETTQHMIGIPLARPLQLTSYLNTARIMQELYNFGWQNLFVKMRGAHNRSINHATPSNFNLISALGNRNNFNYMIDTANNLGYNFFIESDFVNIRSRSIFDGFGRNRDTARQPNRQRAEGYGHSWVWFGEHLAFDPLADFSALATPNFTSQLIQNFVQSASQFNVRNIAFRSIASQLSSDFNESRHISREESINIRRQSLSQLSYDGVGIWINYGFSYALAYADIITSLPVQNQGFNLVYTSVPFIQIALHGIIPFAGEPINLADDYSEHLLRTIESGSMLFFSFMDESASLLMETSYRRYFANEYERWKDIANELYQRFYYNFGHLYNQLIIDHQILKNGVTVTIYEDGTRVYVNTSLDDFEINSGIIYARNYKVVR